ncbi:Intradiol ring-cleavage dioxygenase [Sphaerosporella brunnea]|uniref:Intradiol ring-cleavage dioxygenase n=1 Tax=Sphaerosporella brunnea TaxID=1250544 RepID=A0A5J5EUL3_9PEZI|nr:Intradiol ring-cleavage dioxygenase [Sphaerosporella brunnea]
MAILSTLLTALLAATAAVAHDDSPGALSRRAIHRLEARNLLSACSQKLRARELVEPRLARRAELLETHFRKRGLDALQMPILPDGNSRQPVPCILTPEVTVGPYYAEEELIRSEISEGQEGIELLLDFQFVDVKTCLPVPNAMVDIWHCNTTGTYSAFEVEHTVGESFNRGLQPTDQHGIMHMKTSFPGWYQGRATHIHLAAHINGTIDSETHTYKGGVTNHIGQVFFPEDVLEQVDVTAPYNTITVSRLRNSDDSIFLEENTGYDAVAGKPYRIPSRRKSNRS